MATWLPAEVEPSIAACKSVTLTTMAAPYLMPNQWKSTDRRRKHCALAVVRQSQKFSPCCRPPSYRGRGMAKILSAGDGHYLYLQTQFGEDRCTQLQVIVVTDPPTHPQTGAITIHCAAASAQCNNVKSLNTGHKLLP